ncbi:hypothetical protein D3C87_2048960 [compost metagenome]
MPSVPRNSYFVLRFNTAVLSVALAYNKASAKAAGTGILLSACLMNGKVFFSNPASSSVSGLKLFVFI